MKEKITKRGIILGIILLVISTSVIPGLSEETSKDMGEMKNIILSDQSAEKTMTIFFYGYGRTGIETRNVVVSVQEATQLYAQFEQAIDDLTMNPERKETRQVQNELKNLLDRTGIHSNRIAEIVPILAVPLQGGVEKQLPTQNTGTTVKPTAASSSLRFICNVGSRGIGMLLPPIQLPRPRILGIWAGFDAKTSIASLLPFGGVIASGNQQGVIGGFIGIGAAFAFPTGPTYAFVGYALMIYITADDIVAYP